MSFVRTKTLFWPNEKEPLIEAEITRDGSIHRSLAYNDTLDCWLDCTVEIKERPSWIQRAQDFARDADWNDHGDDWSVETLKESVAKIIGVKAI